MPDTSTILSLPYILPAQAQKHVTHNEALRQLDVIVQLAVTARNLSTPPIGPVQGGRYIVDAGASGDWAGKSGQIALFDAGAWQFFAPMVGWTAWIAAESALATYNGTLWVTQGDAPQSFNQIGVSATADATNRLTVSSPATLLNHAGAGHQLKLNKAATTDTASLLFQTGFSGRAEMGTAGNDDFSIKVSADGSAFVTGLSIAGVSGEVTLPAALRLGGQSADPVSPANGMIWLNSTTGEVKIRSNGASVVIASVNGVANAQLVNMAAATFKGRDTGTAGAPQDLTPAQAAALLPVVTSTARGLAPASGGGSTNFLRADGTWAVPPAGGGLGSFGLTATAAQINPLANVFENAFLGAGTTGNLAVGANDFASMAFWPASSTTNGVTVAKVGSGIDADALQYVDYSVTGTASADTTSGTYLNASSRVPANSGQTYTSSFIARIIGGTAPPADNGVRADVIGETATSVFVEASTSAVVAPAVDAIVTASRTLNTAATNQARGVISIITRAGVSVSYTVRLKAVQFDRAVSRQSYVFKSLSAAQARVAMGVQGAGNVLINGTGRVNQRGYVSGAATTAANQFTLDRWFVITSGQNLAFAGSSAGMTITAPSGGVAQVIEGANITGGTYCLSWVGTATATINGALVTNGGTVTLTAGANATVRFTGGTFTQAQLELGTVPTPYQRLDVSEELRRCQRFYQTVATSAQSPAIGVLISAFYLVVQMRATPTLTVAAGGTTSNSSVTADVVNTPYSGYLQINATAASGWCIGRTYALNAELTA
jgi:hypothetical protein